MIRTRCIVPILAAILTFASCAPDDFLRVDTLRPPKVTAKKKLPYVLMVEQFKAEKDIPSEFHSNALFKPIAVRGNTADAVGQSFTFYLMDTRFFERVYYRERKRYKPDLLLKGKLKRFHWKETGSIWWTGVLSFFTLYVYPLAGGAVNWPSGDAAIEVTLVDLISGKTIGTYGHAARYEEGLSIYRNEEDTPKVQLLEAYTQVVEKIVTDMHKDVENLPEKINNLRNPLFTIKITEPEKGRSYKSGEKIRLKAEVASREGLAECLIYLDDRLVKAFEQETGKKQAKIDYSFAAPDGDRKIRFVAYDVKGNEKSVSVGVNMEPKPKPKPKPGPKPKPKKKKTVKKRPVIRK